MDETLIDKISVDIAWAMLSQKKGFEIHTDPEEYYHRHMVHQEKEKVRIAAIAAITATHDRLMEPTGAMLQKGYEALNQPSSALIEGHWHAMLRAGPTAQEITNEL